VQHRRRLRRCRKLASFVRASENEALFQGAVMRRSSVLLLASLGLGLSACGWQVHDAPKPEPVAAARPAGPGAVKLAANGQPAGDPNQVICKHDDVTGSRLEGAKECHTRAEWLQIKTAGYDQMQMQRAGGAGPTQPSGR